MGRGLRWLAACALADAGVVGGRMLGPPGVATSLDSGTRVRVVYCCLFGVPSVGVGGCAPGPTLPKPRHVSGSLWGGGVTA